MKPLIVYLAVSLDGYIAREDGAVDWLDQIPNPDGLDFGYADFYASIDTLLMGRGTYEEVLGFGVEWPYTGKITYVVTSNASLDIKTPDTRVLSENPVEAIDQMRASEGTSGIWLVGGAKLIASLIKSGLVDELILTVIPVVLGDGIRLFQEGIPEHWLELRSTESFGNGVINLHYAAKVDN